MIRFRTAGPLIQVIDPVTIPASGLVTKLASIPAAKLATILVIVLALSLSACAATPEERLSSGSGAAAPSADSDTLIEEDAAPGGPEEDAASGGFKGDAASGGLEAEADFQGSWKGTHFGQEWLAVFEGNHVRIYCDGQLTDDTDYVLIGDVVRPDRLKSGVVQPVDEYDYEEFSVISSIRKDNESMLTAYFMKDTYSTCDLLIQR